MMSRTLPTLTSVLQQARRLSPDARYRLAEQLLRPTEGDEQVVMFPVRRLGMATQRRFQELMDRSNDGTLGQKEKREFEALVARYESLLLLNSEALLKATHPDLFASSGRLVKRRLNRALRQKSAPKVK